MSWSAAVSAIPATDAVTALRVAFKVANRNADTEDTRQFELAALWASKRVGEVQSHNGLVNITASGPGFNAQDPDDGGSPYFDAEVYFDGRKNADGTEYTDPFVVEVTPAGPEFVSPNPLRTDVNPRTGVPHTEAPIPGELNYAGRTDASVGEDPRVAGVSSDGSLSSDSDAPRPPRRRPNR